jgi:hypothetical protein
MTTIYKVLNPSDGTYTSHVTEDSCLERVIDVAYQFYLNHTHNIPYSVVTMMVDGSETWKTPSGSEMPNMEELRKKMAEKLEKLRAEMPAVRKS